MAKKAYVNDEGDERVAYDASDEVALKFDGYRLKDDAPKQSTTDAGTAKAGVKDSK